MALNQQNTIHLTMQELMRKKIIWAGHVASVGEGKKSYRIFVRIPERKGLLEILRRKWGDNIKKLIF